MFLWQQGTQSLAGAPGNYFKANKNVFSFQNIHENSRENILKFWFQVTLMQGLKIQNAERNLGFGLLKASSLRVVPAIKPLAADFS